MRRPALGEALGCIALVAAGLGGCDSASTAARDSAGATDVVFVEILVPDGYDASPGTDTALPTDTAPRDTTPPADTALDASDVGPDTRVDSTETPDATAGDDSATAPDADPSDGDTTSAPTDTSVVDTAPPAPFCGDGSCNGDEDCLACADCACPERCAGDLFLSAYLEGDVGFDKALEIFNFTGRPVDLAAYALWKITNGGEWSEASPLALAGTLAPGEVFVVCHADAVPSLLTQCDFTSSQDALQFNGNDAVGLAHNGVLIDLIGTSGVAPTGGFTVAGVANATKDHRLVRIASVSEGTTDWTLGAAEWRVEAPSHVGVGVGSHAVAATCAMQAKPPAQLNEIRFGAGASDFVEIAIGLDAPVDLGGWRIATTGGQFTLPPGPPLAAGALRAVPRAELGFALGVIDIVYLYDSAGALQDVAAVSAADLAADGPPQDQSWGRLPDLTGAFQALSLATPGLPNQDPDHYCGDAVCQLDEDCTTCVVDCGPCRALPGELVVTEILTAPTAGPEWFEVTSVATVPLDLDGLILRDEGSDFHVVSATGGATGVPAVSLPVGGRLVFGSAPGPAIDYVFSGVALDAANDSIVLEVDGAVIDSVAWTSAPTPSGTAWSLDPTALDASDNDLAASWCAAVDLGPDGQLGTPGDANPVCVVAPSCGDGTCDPDEDCTLCPDDCGACNVGCASGLFISEYVEGASFNKAVEIANFTGQPVDLGQYAIWKISNDGVWTENAPLFLSGSLPDGDVYVICNDGASPALLAACDLPTNKTHLGFNGDDAIGLAHGATLIDAIGTEATSGTGWTVAGVNNATTDHVLVRKPSVRGPTTDWMSGAATEWLVLGPDAFSGLGSHTVDYTCP